MMLPDVTRELALARQAELRSIARPVVRIDHAGTPPARRLARHVIHRVAEQLRGRPLPRPAGPLPGTP